MSSNLGCSPIVQYTNLTINGNTISNVAGNFSDCCQYCQQKSNCVAYSWYNGTCILKSSAQPLYKAVGYLTAVLSPNSNNTYSLQTSYNGSTFFNNFTFISYTDPSGGDVNYTTQAQAQSLGLVQVLAGGQVYIGVDNTTIVPLNATRGRAAVRIQSKPIYNSGLFIFNLAHMPEGLGTWPAFWSYANPWPYNGEIDILEAIYTMPNNQISLHTSQNCTMPSNPGYINGAWGTKTTDCFTNYTAGISGCSIEAPNGTFGSAFNQAGGGVFAMEWDRFNFIRIWNFVQPNIPSDIASRISEI
uniref:GH16 domain-containing protein n=1 Tax=Acrobeloides nanus TaxID=290746 RepID=A0A914DY04_9BILA